MDSSGFWTQFSTDWACLDYELVPWSVKAQEILPSQYAAVGASGRASLPKAVAVLRRAAERRAGQAESSPIAGPCSYTSDVDGLLRQYGHRGEAIEQFVSAYWQYCWPVKSLDDMKVAPFHLMATEGKVGCLYTCHPKRYNEHSTAIPSLRSVADHSHQFDSP